MNDENWTQSQSRYLSGATEVDALCDAFEAAWRDGAEPRVEQFLKTPEERANPRLVRELLHVEVARRAARGDSVTREELLDRFPEHRDDIDGVLRIARIAASPERLGEYSLLEPLGRGGMGVVHKARHSRLDRVVAIKILPAHLTGDTAAVSRFEQEMRAVGRLDHPNVVRATDAGEASGQHYLAMEYVDGVDVGKLLKKHGRLPLAESCEIIRQAAIGLQHAFEHDLVHRDIKPSNLMLSRAGTVKLLDLGLARVFREGAVEDDLTHTGQIIGTFDYMAPEQSDNSRGVDIRADIYSLGCTLFALVAGAPPFSGEAYRSVRGKLKAHAETPPPNLHSIDPELPERFAAVTSRMLAKRPEDRYATPLDVATALAPFAKGADLLSLLEDTSVRTPITSTTATRRREWRGSRRRLLAWGAGSAAVFAAGGSAWWWMTEGSGAPQGVSRALADALPTLPGLNGVWWFEEIPWFIPHARAELAETLADRAKTRAVFTETASGKGHALADHLVIAFHSPNTAEAYAAIKEVARRRFQQLPASQSRLLLAFLELDPSVIDDGDFNVETNKLVDRLLPKGEAASALDWHLVALLHHRAEDWAAARSAYESALAKYDASDQEGEKAVAPLCLVDFGQMLADAGEPVAAVASFRQAASQTASLPSDAMSFFQINLLCSEADACRAFGAWKRAKESLEKAIELGPAPERHPLACWARERMAWFWMDRWRIDPATEEFRLAEAARRQLIEEGSDFSRALLLHDRHGLALTGRYIGQLKEAQKSFDGIIATIEADLAAPGQTLKRRRYLLERLLNTLERRADCDLFGLPAGGDAVRLYTVALERRSRDKLIAGTDEIDIARRRLKRSLADFLAGDAAAASADVASAAKSIALLTAGQREQIKLLHVVTMAALKTDPNKPESQRELRQALADEFRQKHDSITRDDLDLLLLAVGILLREPGRGRGKLDDETRSLAREFTRLPFEDARPVEILPYLRPTQDRLLRRLVAIDPLPTREVLDALAARWAGPGASLDPDKLPTALFALEEDRGYAVAPASNRVFELPFGLRAATNNAVPLTSVPAPLVDLLKRPGATVAWGDKPFGLEPSSWPKGIVPARVIDPQSLTVVGKSSSTE